MRIKKRKLAAKIEEVIERLRRFQDHAELNEFSDGFNDEIEAAITSLREAQEIICPYEGVEFV